ncbi:MAG: isochorismatase family protein [Chloroflexi bacterium]|nr:isochorismatase family protein [Chloroflexota bacterium]
MARLPTGCIATSGVVLTTVRWAADLDYSMNIIRDLCADRDEEVHRVLLEKVLNRMAPLMTSDEFIKAVSR